jgi:hypothetical protein
LRGTNTSRADPGSAQGGSGGRRSEFRVRPVTGTGRCRISATRTTPPSRVRRVRRSSGRNRCPGGPRSQKGCLSERPPGAEGVTTCGGILDVGGLLGALREVGHAGRARFGVSRWEDAGTLLRHLPPRSERGGALFP